MKKPYEAHEVLYKRMRASRQRCWEDLNGQEHHDGVEAYLERFLTDALGMPWAPKGGKAVEFGCGTGPVLRWLARRGFGGVGIEISRTAVAMAREQTQDADIRFVCGDVCVPRPTMTGKFDLVVDGHCLHCLTEPKDRGAFLSNARQMLRPGGLILVSTMCSPIDRKGFASHFQQRPVGGVVYVPVGGAEQYHGCRVIKSRPCLPTRYIGHWRRILGEIKAAGFLPQLIKLSLHTTDDPTSSLCVGALATER